MPANAQNPVVIVPGMVAASLDDHYSLPPQNIWAPPPGLHWPFWNRDYGRVALHPDDPRYEAREPARVLPGGPAQIVYADLAEELRSNLSEPGRPTPVFPFTYDWRQDCARSADALAGFIEEVIERSRLLPHYRGAAMRVDLVCHSLGGLIAADYLCRYGHAGQGRVERVVSLGAPFGGSVDAVLKLTIGKGSLAGDHPRDRERFAARSVPSLYQLLPTYVGAVDSPQPDLRDLLRPQSWQPSLARSLDALARSLGAETSGGDMLAGFLDRARAFRQRLRGLDLGRVLPTGRAGWLCLAGVGSATQVRVGNRLTPDGSPRLRFLEDEDQWRADRESEATGDGTVPFAGALPGFLPREALVCLTPADFSRWELGDRLAARVAGFHSFLPALNLAQRLIIRFLKSDYTGEVWGWKPPGVAWEDWQPPDWLQDRR